MPVNSVNGALSAVERLNAVNKASSETEFSDILNEALSDVTKTEADVLVENDNLLTGETDSIHSAVIASEKAEIALSLAVQIRNKVVDAYNEIMNMQI